VPAQRTYGVTGRQLRNTRSAAVLGALARRAAELGIELPAGFAPGVPKRVNGHQFDEVAA
jgi:hypothetical protein